MAVSMIGPKFYAWDRNGKPLSFGKLYTYEARTNVPKPTYQSEDQVVENTNPVVLNGEGYANVYLSGSYKMVLKDCKDNEIWSSDPVSSLVAEEWSNCSNASYLSPNSFKLVGNLTDTYTKGRKVRLDSNSSEYDYSTIDSASYSSGGTTIFLLDPVVRTGLISSCSSIISPESVDISGFTSYQFKTIQDMISLVSVGGIPVSASAGLILDSGKTKWLVTDETQQIQLSNSLYVKPIGDVWIDDFGLVGDDSTDNIAAFSDAENYTFSYSIGEGVFCTSGVHSFKGSFFGRGSKKSVIKNIDIDNQKEWLITFDNVDGGIVCGISIDGQCSYLQGTPNLDPSSWNSSNYDTWYGARGVIFSFCKNLFVYDVQGLNSGGGACIRAERCEDTAFHKCYGQRARGNFGDIFYSVGGLRIRFTDCHAYDHTRIGFVSEGNISTRISSEISYVGCTTRYGHDGSVNYGGAEFATGFWAENTDDCGYVNCHARDVEDTGFIYAPTYHVDGKDGSSVSYEGCTVNKALIGMRCGAALANETKVNASYLSCSVYNVTQGYVSNPSADTVAVVTWQSCHATCDGSGSNSIAFEPDPNGEGDFTFNIKDCSSRWLDTSGLPDTAKNNGDISQFRTFSKYLNVNGFSNKTTDVYIKNRNGSVDISYNLRNIEQPVFIYDSKTSPEFNIENCVVYGELQADILTLKNVSVKNGEQLIAYNCAIYGDIRLVDSSLYVHHMAGVLETKKVVGELNVHMERDVASSDYGLRIQCEQDVKPTFIIDGSFYNSGAAAAAGENFIWLVRAGTGAFTKGAIKDETVPNIYRVNTSPGNFAIGQQDVTLH